MPQDMDVGMKCIKYMLCVANAMFVMIGFLLISIGSTIKSMYSDFDGFLSSYFFSPANLTIAIGIIIFFIALFGCVGAIRESVFLINLFAAFLCLLFVLEIITTGLAYSSRGKLYNQLSKSMHATQKTYSSSSPDQELWDFTQSRLHCCGFDAAQDWQVDYDNKSNFTGAISCCDDWNGERVSDLTSEKCMAKEVYTDGCFVVVKYLIGESALLLGCGVLAVAFIQILGVVFAVMLSKSVRQLKTQQLVDRELHRQQIYDAMNATDYRKDSQPTPVLYTPSYTEC